MSWWSFFNLLMFAHLLWLFKCDFFSSMLSYGVVLLFTKFTKCMWVFYLDFGHVGFKAYYTSIFSWTHCLLLSHLPLPFPSSQFPLHDVSSPLSHCFPQFCLFYPSLFWSPHTFPGYHRIPKHSLSFSFCSPGFTFKNSVFFWHAL